MFKQVLLTLKVSMFGLFILGCTTKHLSLSDAIKQCTDKKQAKGGISMPAPSCATGALFPPIEATTITGLPIDKSYFKGKISIVNLWFIGCPPCVAEVPGLNQIVNKYGRDRVQYLAIGRDTKEDIEVFLKDHPWGFDHVSNGRGVIDNYIQSPWGYPTTFLVDEKGVIAKVTTGGFSDSRAIEKIQSELCPILDSLLRK